MKTIIKTIICATLILLPHYGFSQVFGYTQATDLDVKGIFIGGTYTKAQVQAKWGTPTYYGSSTSENGLNEGYDYVVGQLYNQFSFGDNGIFHSFYISTPDFPIFTKFNGGIKVGDTLSKLNSLGLGTLVMQNDTSFALVRNNCDDSIIFTFRQSDEVITQIRFMTTI